MTVYRAISKPNQPLLQSPMHWVRQQPAFGPLSENPDPEHAALLARVGSANIEKVWTELAYEAVREAVAQDAPSRLDSLYAFADPLEAFAFQQHTDVALDVWEGEVTAEARWGLVDMSGFGVIHPETTDPDSYSRAWEAACVNARRYWTPEGAIDTAEMLVDGQVLLARKLDLLPTLRELGLIA